jgi:hypothetical protein
MKVKLSRLIDSEMAINYLITAIDKDGKFPFDGQTSYRINRVKTILDQEIKKFHEFRITKLKEICDKDESGNPIIIENNGLQEYQLSNESTEIISKFILEAKEEEININVLSITPASIAKAESIPVALYTILDWFIVDECQQ